MAPIFRSVHWLFVQFSHPESDSNDHIFRFAELLTQKHLVSRDLCDCRFLLLKNAGKQAATLSIFTNFQISRNTMELHGTLHEHDHCPLWRNKLTEMTHFERLNARDWIRPISRSLLTLMSERITSSFDWAGRTGKGFQLRFRDARDVLWSRAYLATDWPHKKGSPTSDGQNTSYSEFNCLEQVVPA